MDEKVETLESQMETAGEGVPPAHEQDAADTAATTAPRALDLNELQELSDKKLKALARDVDLACGLIEKHIRTTVEQAASEVPGLTRDAVHIARRRKAGTPLARAMNRS